jgi:SAM-dependent methyltransferase/uncharacterized protein YbaR (Trm112 family)
MRAELLDYICCPDCKADLRVDTPTRSGKTIVSGTLACTACPATFPIVDGVPNFVRGAEGDVEQTTEGFAENWENYNRIILSNSLLNRDLFTDWIWPLQPTYLEDKVVIEAGCGMGRWLRVAAERRPKVLIGFDYSSIARRAAENVAHLDNVHVVQADIFHLPFRAIADVQYSIGVVHHTPDPAGAFASLARILAPGGVISCWVYGAENNEWVTRFVDPVRTHITSKLPPAALNALSQAAALQLRAASAIYHTLGGAKFLPYRDYIMHLRTYPFDYMTHIVYDHLVPSIAAYIPRAEAERWANNAGLWNVISPRNANSWRIFGGKSRAAVDAAVAPVDVDVRAPVG